MGLINNLTRNVYMPVCRAYARCFVGDKPADAVLRLLASLHFWKVHRYWPQLENPRTFEEKVNCRMLFDRDPRWILFCDKLRVREYVATRVGDQYLVPLLWTGDNPEDIPFDQLPNQFVIKANHGCYFNIIVTDKAKLDKAAATRQLGKWLATNFGRDVWLGTQWAYSKIMPRLLAEPFIGKNGVAPLDYKFFCFSGRARYVQMNFDRFGDPFEKFFDRDLNPLDLWQGTKQYPDPVPRPPNYDEMIGVAESLAQGLDFIRVDLYNVGGRVYFGELTCYPSAGSTAFVPESYDFLWGEKWIFKQCETVCECP